MDAARGALLPVLLAGCTPVAPDVATATSPGAFAPLAAPAGHAHNDYLHGRPLQQALAAGFRSVEADVFVSDGDLFVGHDRWMLRPGRTLDRLYLAPLAQRVRERGGSVHGDGQPFVLLVDVKRDATRACQLLEDHLARYRPMLTGFVGDTVQPGAVTVIVSGHRPSPDALASRQERWFALDGRIADLEFLPSPAVMPLLSDAWSRWFEWDAAGAMPEDERARLREFVQRAHAAGRWLRLWGAPDRPECWAEQAAAGIDWINTDRLADFARWRETFVPAPAIR